MNKLPLQSAEAKSVTFAEGLMRSTILLKGPYHCYCTLLSFVNICHTGYSQNNFICNISYLFTFCPYSIKVTEST